jgi:hypothetical protein
MQLVALSEPESPMITFLCMSCGGILKVETKLAGRIGQCSHCGQWTRVPAQLAAPKPAGDRSSRGLVLPSTVASLLLLFLGGAIGFCLGRLGTSGEERLRAQEVRSAAVSPDSPFDAAAWQDAALVAEQGTLAVKIKAAQVRYVELLQEPALGAEGTAASAEVSPKEDLWKSRELVLSFAVENAGPQPFVYQHPRKEETKLIDEHGNLFRQIYADGARIKGQLRQAVIAPGQAVEDVLVFSCSFVGKGNQLLLELPAQNFGGEPGDTLRLRMEQKAIAR